MQSSFFRPVLAALFAGLIVVGAYVIVPFWPVPFVLSNFFALFAGLLLGPVWGSAAVALYLGLGALGLPVFQGGNAGFAYFFGPTGGFLLAYLPMAFLAGFLARGFGAGRRPEADKGKAKGPGFIRLGLAGLAGLVVLYAVGLPWFEQVMHGKNAEKFPDLWAATLFMAPFMLGDLAKLVAAVVLTRSLRPLFG